MHGLDSNIGVLRRWADLSEQPLPRDWRAFCDSNATEAVKIRVADPELVSLLDGSASAGLRADALAGEWGERKSPEQRAEEFRKASVNEIREAGNPYAADSPNLTNQLRLEQLDPMAAATLRKAAEPQANQWSEAVYRADQARNRKAVTESHEHGQRLAKAQYPRIAAARRQQQWEAARLQSMQGEG